MKKTVKILLLIIAVLLLPIQNASATESATSFKGMRTTAFLFDRSDLKNYIGGGSGALEDALSKIDSSRFHCSTEQLERDLRVTVSFNFNDQEEYENLLKELLGYSPSIVYQSGQLFAFTENFDSAELLNIVRRQLESGGCLQELAFDELMVVEKSTLKLNGKTYTTKDKFDVRQDIRPKYNNLSTYIPARMETDFGDAEIKLKPGFDFIETGSSQINWDLALTCVTLSAQTYDEGKVQEQMASLGWNETTIQPQPDAEQTESENLVSVFGYQHLSDETGEKNIFAVVSKWEIDDFDSLFRMRAGMPSILEKGCENLKGQLFEFMQVVTEKTMEQLSLEDNYFLFTGHGFGGAAINLLSIDSDVFKLALEDRDKIYSYTFSAPCTYSGLWLLDVSRQTNAFNFKDEDDPIIHIPPYPGAATYGENVTFTAKDLETSIFHSLFPNVDEGGVNDALKVENYGNAWGHHTPALPLAYILQCGADEGYWSLENMFSSYS